MTEFIYKIVDSCEGFNLRAVYKHQGSEILCYHLVAENGAVEVFHSLSAAEQRLDDLANSFHYENLAAMPLLGKR